MVTGSRNSQTGQLRIVAGIWRSRRLKIADVTGLRPTSARVRETLFNWLAPELCGARCLDLCAGTGALGLEALSRGAGSVVFVESSQRAASTLRDNVESLDAAGAEVWHGDARQYLGSAEVGKFDVVFLDPPYAAELLNELCRLLDRHEVLAINAKVYLELEKQQAIPELPRCWQVLRNKTAGRVRYMLASAMRMESD